MTDEVTTPETPAAEESPASEELTQEPSEVAPTEAEVAPEAPEVESRDRPIQPEEPESAEVLSGGQDVVTPSNFTPLPGGNVEMN